MSKKILLGGWLIKIAFSVSFIFIFTHYFGNGSLYGDAANFFNDGKILAEYGRENFFDYLKIIFGIGSDNPDLLSNQLSETQIWSAGENGDLINDNRLIIKINSLVHFFSFSNVYVHALIFSFLSYIGIIFIYKTFKTFVSNQHLFFLTIVSLPSIAFWGGGLTKESLMIFGLGMFFYQLFQLIQNGLRFKTLLILFLSIAILLLNKPYTGLIVLPLSLILISGKYINWNPKFLWGWTGLIVITAVSLSFVPEPINLISKTSYKQQDLINMGKGGVFFTTDSSFCAFEHKYLDHFTPQDDRKIKVLKSTAGTYKLFGQSQFYPFNIKPSNKEYDLYLIMAPSKSYIDVTPINYSGLQLVYNIPESLINTVLRPFPSDPGSNFKYLIFLQNIFLIILLLYASFKRKFLKNKEKFIVYYLLSAALIIFLIIGWTTPILGAIVRYKIGAELFILIASFLLMKPLKMKLK